MKKFIMWKRGPNTVYCIYWMCVYAIVNTFKKQRTMGIKNDACTLQYLYKRIIKNYSFTYKRSINGVFLTLTVTYINYF